MSYFENGRAVALGLALIDEKIYNPQLAPPDGKDLPTFLNEKRLETVRAPGGITSNVISAFSDFSPSTPARLIARVGNDERGQYFTNNTSPSLGDLQIDKVEQTGVALSVLNADGSLAVRRRFFGAASNVIVSKEEQEEKNMLFITDLFTVKNQKTHEQAQLMIMSVVNLGGIFVLNLGGMNPANGSSEELSQTLSEIYAQPNFIIGNESEYKYLTGKDDMTKIIEDIFPSSDIVVITRGEKGSLIRFNGQIYEIPSFKIANDTMVDETGAGDCYLGVTLSALTQKGQTDWDSQHLTKSAMTGSFASSLVVQSPKSRLNSEEMARVRSFYNTYKNPLA